MPELSLDRVKQLSNAAERGDNQALATLLREINDLNRKDPIAETTAALTLSRETHGNRKIVYSDADGAITLPAATGSGVEFMIVIGIAATSLTITATGEFAGGVNGVDDDADAPYAWKAEDDDDTITLNGTSTGGKIHDWFRFTDIVSGHWLVEGFITQSGGSEATPFSAA